MHRFFVEASKVIGTTSVYIEEASDVKHLVKVLRATIGEKIEICDSTGREFLCEIEEIFKDQVVCGILEDRTVQRESVIKVHLYQGLPKADKMEIIIQKNVELGTSHIIPVAMDRAVAKINDPKDLIKKTERWQKIADEAAKQSKRSAKVDIEPMIEFKNVISRLDQYDAFFMPYELESSTSLRQPLEALVPKLAEKGTLTIGLLVGPEGGISEKELNAMLTAGGLPVTLGPRILRTETAGFTAAAIIQFALGDLG